MLSNYSPQSEVQSNISAEEEAVLRFVISMMAEQSGKSEIQNYSIKCEMFSLSAMKVRYIYPTGKIFGKAEVPRSKYKIFFYLSIDIFYIYSLSGQAGYF